MTPTPRTNAEAFPADIGDWGQGHFVPANFARQLERELATERALADRLMGELQWWGDHYKTADDQEAIAEWKKARQT